MSIFKSKIDKKEDYIIEDYRYISYLNSML